MKYLYIICKLAIATSPLPVLAQGHIQHIELKEQFLIDAITSFIERQDIEGDEFHTHGYVTLIVRINQPGDTLRKYFISIGFDDFDSERNLPPQFYTKVGGRLVCVWAEELADVVSIINLKSERRKFRRSFEKWLYPRRTVTLRGPAGNKIKIKGKRQSYWVHYGQSYYLLKNGNVLGPVWE